jgi:peptide-methionine (S)-S-oxide reductase
MKKLFLIILFTFMNSFFTSPTFAGNDDHVASPTTAQAVLGGGCFWCMEALFQKLPGVLSVQSGFAGGTTKNPNYEKVCVGNTGHAEVIEITYDPQKISYNQLLDLFWRAHDPTTWNQQGADLGPQYRSVIFTTSPEQQQIAEASKKNAQAYFEKPIVTEIKPLTHFYPAEKYHQNYYLNNRNAPYCRAVIAPKLQKLHME